MITIIILMKIIIIGSNGMLGHALMKVFKEANPAGWDLGDIDITNEAQMRSKIKDYGPDIIINAAAYTNVDKAEQEQDLAFRVNAQGIKNLVEAALECRSILIHYSTDYVFGNEEKEGYTEDTLPKEALNIYGKSKRRGEEELLSSIPKGLKGYLIRSSWLFGPDGKNFVQTMISLSKDNKMLKVVNDQWGKPTYTYDLAKATKDLIDNNYQFGVYHLVNEPSTNWHAFAKEIIDIEYNNHSQIEIIPVTSEEFPRPAKRPHYSILLNIKGPKLRPWKEALHEYIKIHGI